MERGERPYSSVWLDLERVAFRQDFIDAGGIRTRILSSGDEQKPLLLFLHGTGGHAEAYARNLGAHANEFWTVAIDMVGHGWSDKPLVAYEISTYADHVLQVLKALGRSAAHISGVSLGGWVATHLAIHRPEVVDRLVLNTAAGWTAHPEVMAMVLRVSRAASENPTYELMRRRLELVMYDKSQANEDLVQVRRSIYLQPGFAEINERILCLQDMDTRRRNMFTRQQYGTIRAPTLVVWTSHDPTATVAEGREIASMIPGSRFELIEDAGHWPQFEAAEQFNRIHLDFLRGRPAADGAAEP